MPRFGQTDDDLQVMNITGATGFQFSAIRPEHLGATEYTLIAIVLDVTGSVTGFASQLLEMVKAVVQACRKSPRAENLLLRFLTFNTQIDEVHGFKPLADINEGDYQALQPFGMTALFDAGYSAIGSILTYGKTLQDQDFGVNGACYIITDGEDNASRVSPAMIRDLMAQAVTGEQIESIQAILIGINTGNCRASLDDFAKQANLSAFIDAGDVTPQKLAKIAGYVSKSISSQSQSLGTKGPSQVLQF